MGAAGAGTRGETVGAGGGCEKKRAAARLLGAVLVALAAIFPAANGHAAIAPAANRAALSANRTLNWMAMGTLGNNVGNSVSVAVGGAGLVATAQVSCAASGVMAQVRQSLAGGLGDWGGNFSPNDPACYTTGAPLVIGFSGLSVRAAGFHIQSESLGAFTARLRYYSGVGGTGTLLQTHTVAGTSTAANNGTAVFLGGVSDAAATDFKSLVIDLTAASSTPARFAINNVDFREVSQPQIAVQSGVPTSATAALLRATVDPGGRDATATFYYGASPTALSSSAAATPSPVSGTGATLVTAPLGLVAGQRVYFQVGATNVNGTTFSGVSSYVHLGPGAPDFSFSGDGIQITPILDGATMRPSIARAVAVQSDGKIVAAGFAHNGTNNDFVVARYLADGSLDGSFGTAGVVRVAVSVGDDYALGAALQPDGKIVVCGAAHGSGSYAMAAIRLNPNGSLDDGGAGDSTLGDAFNGDGIFLSHRTTALDAANAVTVDSAGRIVLVGYFEGGNQDARLVRLTNSGAADNTFSGDGDAVLGFNSNEDIAHDVAVAPSGKIFVTGHAHPAGSRTAAVWRCNNDGSLDAQWSTAAGTATSQGAGLALTADGGVVVCGYAYDGSGTLDKLAVVRYRADGSLEPTFGTGGIRKFNIAGIGGGYANAFKVAVQPDGRIVCAGFAIDGSNNEMLVVRLNPDGSNDATFAGSGVALLGPAAAGVDRLYDVAFTPDGGIVAAGSSDSAAGVAQFAVVKLLGGPNELLVNGGFEADESLGGGLATVFGDWRQDFASTVGVENGITPYEGARMAKFRGTTDSGAQGGNADGDLSQYVDLSAYAAQIDSGNVQVTATAHFNRVAGTASTDTQFNLLLIAGHWTPLAGSVTPNFGSQTTTLLSDANPATWEPLTNTYTLPAGTRHLFVNPYARENISENGTAPEFDGHYVDGVTLTLTIPREIQVEAPVGTILTDGSATVDFGSTPLGTPVTRTFTVRNLSNVEAVNLTAITLPAGYELVAPFTPVAIPADGSHSFDVRFLAHTVTGVFSGTLTLLNDDPDEGDFEVNLTARALNGGDPAQLDFTFHFDGTQFVPFIGRNTSSAQSVAQQADGKLVVVGGTYYSDQFISFSYFAVARFNSAGALDTTFWADGKTEISLGNGTHSSASMVAIQTDGKIVVAGSAINSSTGRDFALVRLNPTGALDSSFGAGGKVTTSFTNGSDSAWDIVIQPDGKIVAVGVAQGTTFYDLAIARYLPDGSLDASFGTAGKIMRELGDWDYLSGVALDSSGKILVVGRSASSLVLARYTANGLLDSSFGSSGIVTASGAGTDVAIQPDGKIVVAGHNNGDFLVRRYFASGAPDTSFGTGGEGSTDFAGDSDVAEGLALQSDGKLVLGGWATRAGRRVFALARYLPSGALDTTFGTIGRQETALGQYHSSASDVALQADGKIVAVGYAVNSSGWGEFAIARYGANLAPAVTTLSAASVTATAAQLSASIDAKGVATSGWFEWGTTPGYGQTTLATGIGHGSGAITLSQNLSGLSPGTTYFFRAVAVNGEASAVGAGQGFTTLTVLQAWRQSYFGTTDNAGNAADVADPDIDGVLNLFEFAFGTDPTVAASGVIVVSGGTVAQRGTPAVWMENTPYGVDYRALFGRRKDYLVAGLTYTVQFSADLLTWETSTATPTVIASDSDIDAVTVPYPFFLSTGQKAQFFRVIVTGP